MGKVFIAGGGKMNVPSAGVLASSLAVDSIVKLMENNQPVDYLVVHQGLPGPMYDESCNGCWLLRKDIYSVDQFSSFNDDQNDYWNSIPHDLLTGDFLKLFNPLTLNIVKQIKIPYEADNGLQTGSNGLPCQFFILSGNEVGINQGFGMNLVADGVLLSYFSLGDNSTANNKRIAQYNGIDEDYWTRTPPVNGTTIAIVREIGWGTTSYTESSRHGIRPALILPSNALFDKETMQLKGIKGGM